MSYSDSVMMVIMAGDEGCGIEPKCFRELYHADATVVSGIRILQTLHITHYIGAHYILKHTVLQTLLNKYKWRLGGCSWGKKKKLTREKR